MAAEPDPQLTSVNPPTPQVTLKAAEPDPNLAAAGADGEAPYDPDDYYSAMYENPAATAEEEGDAQMAAYLEDPEAAEGGRRGGASPSPSVGRAEGGGGLASPLARSPHAVHSPTSVKDLLPIMGHADEPGGALQRRGLTLRPGDKVGLRGS